MGGVLIIVSVVISVAALGAARPTRRCGWRSSPSSISARSGSLTTICKVTKKNSDGRQRADQARRPVRLWRRSWSWFSSTDRRNAMFSTEFFVPFLKRPLFEEHGATLRLFALFLRLGDRRLLERGQPDRWARRPGHRLHGHGGGRLRDAGFCFEQHPRRRISANPFLSRQRRIDRALLGDGRRGAGISLVQRPSRRRCSWATPARWPSAALSP